MRRIPGSGFGFVMLLVVLAVVLLLVARAWENVAPAALPITTEAAPQTEPAGSGSEPDPLPDLQRMQRTTDEHAERLQQALDEIE